MCCAFMNSVVGNKYICIVLREIVKATIIFILESIQVPPVSVPVHLIGTELQPILFD